MDRKSPRRTHLELEQLEDRWVPSYVTMDLSASAPSRLNLGVESLQLAPCFLDGELPIDGSLLLVDAD
jgi:hypothetical protein